MSAAIAGTTSTRTPQRAPLDPIWAASDLYAYWGCHRHPAGYAELSPGTPFILLNGKATPIVSLPGHRFLNQFRLGALDGNGAAYPVYAKGGIRQ